MRHGQRIIAITLMLVTIIASTAARGADLPTKKPNIVFLLADDLGWTGLRCFGSDFYETPNLDQFAQTGMKFTNAYSACTVCSPTRASIMTGVYPARLHLTDFIAGQNRPWAKLRIPDWTKGLDHSYVTIAEALRHAGYATGQIGKWHLNHAARDAAAYGPKSHGFDVAVDKPRGTKGYKLPTDSNSKGESKSDFLTDYLTDKAVEFIDNSKDKPFFLYFAYHVPHTPIQGREDLVAAFSKKVRADSIHKNATYAAMVASMDQSVGRVLERLDRQGIADNTLVVFTSDNGGLTERYGKHDGFTENLPLRCGKGSAYEGGVRVPTIVRWPGVTEPGSRNKDIVSPIDFAETFCEVAGIEVPGDMHGRSLVPVLKGKTPKDWRKSFYYHYYEYPGWHYVRRHYGVADGRYKLIHFYEKDVNQWELFDLKTDPKEMKSVYGDPAYAKTQKRLAKQLANHRADLKVPETDPPHSIVKRLPPRLRKPTVPK